MTPLEEGYSMLKRTMVSGLVACSLIAVGIAAPAAGAKRTTLKGKTKQGFRIKMAVKSRSVKILSFKVNLKCRDGSVLQVTESGFVPTPVSGKGNFKDVQYGSTDTVYLRGKVRGGKRAIGRLRVKDKLGSGVRCKSSWVKFNVH
jgi:hypothetical protein